ncbi:MAG: ATP-binding protein [Planctomycetota bacterium]|jgi:ferredoxin
MPVRKIIRIDEEKCDGCGLCVDACHEGAIQIIDDKAKLVSETYCDGLGDCLAECPQDAITIEEREAKPFDEAAVAAHLAVQEQSGEKAPAAEATATPAGGGCPGSALRTFDASSNQQKAPANNKPPFPAGGGCPGSAMRRFQESAPPAEGADTPAGPSRLSHWPVQLMLVPPGAPFLKNSDILVCADCVPFAVPDFHARYLTGKTVLVGCPKLDDLAYYEEKLKAIFAEAQPRSVTVIKMEVPCCNGIATAAFQARNEVIPQTKIEAYTIGLQGAELDCEEILAGQLA